MGRQSDKPPPEGQECSQGVRHSLLIWDKVVINVGEFWHKSVCQGYRMPLFNTVWQVHFVSVEQYCTGIIKLVLLDFFTVPVLFVIETVATY